jgi:uncharacterized protein
VQGYPAPMRVLILHGLDGSGGDHWQSWLAGQLGDDAVFPDLPDPSRPRLGAWLDALDGVARDDDVVVCHSLACILWLHARRPAARVLLVAPPSAASGVEQITNFFPVEVAAPRAETLLVCSDDDPYCPEGAAALYGAEIPVKLMPGAGHINPDAGFGAWPWVLEWVQGAKKGVDT